jgi:uncharacterized UBP type Zn finger protein
MTNPNDLKVKQLMEMGFDEQRCRECLEKAEGNVETAANLLFQ